MAMMPPTVTAQMHKVTAKNGKPIFYDTPEIKDARCRLKSYLWKHRPKEPYGVGVRLIVKWLFPKGRHKSGEYRITKPDTDNLVKLLKDVMTKLGFWHDDAQVTLEIIQKIWDNRSGLYVSVEALA